jgi:hypothetical protein
MKKRELADMVWQRDREILVLKGRVRELEDAVKKIGLRVLSVLEDEGPRVRPIAHGGKETRT